MRSWSIWPSSFTRSGAGARLARAGRAMAALAGSAATTGTTTAAAAEADRNARRLGPAGPEAGSVSMPRINDADDQKSRCHDLWALRPRTAGMELARHAVSRYSARVSPAHLSGRLDLQRS